MPSNRTRREFERTRVRFRKLGSREIREYVESGSPMDKAGAYGIQDDYGAVFVERIDGCFYNVVGFPLTKFYTTISDFNHIPE
jgi:septum formation protein